jgi:hypothetical protein
MVLRPSKPYYQSPGLPNHYYDSMLPMWTRSRAVLNGQQAVKQHDNTLDRRRFENILIPFSPYMSDQQYAFYKAEAELPGLVSQYGRIVVGGLLRKAPSLELNTDTIPEEAYQWLENHFTADNRSMIAFLDEALWEEITTSRCFVLIDYPSIANPEALTTEELKSISPYPVMWKAENIINWSTRRSPATGMLELSRIMISYFKEEFEKETDFHPELVEYVADHRLDDSGFYYVNYYRRKSDQTVKVTNGYILPNQRRGISVLGTSPQSADDDWELVGDSVYPEIRGERLTLIPGAFLNGSIQPRDPLLMPLVDREVALYNKMSRRNHLLYTAATFTPVFSTSMSEDRFAEIVEQGLGTYIRLDQGDTVDALKTPTDALGSLDKSIDSTVQELARMGVRMLAPEGNAESGVALEIRNSAQTAQLATLNAKVSQTMRKLILIMLRWKYDIEIDDYDVEFTLSSDFNPSPIGENWLRLVTEWYQSGLIPRSLFLEIGRLNDVIPPEYDDEEGRDEMSQDPTNPAVQANLNPDF